MTISPLFLVLVSLGASLAFVSWRKRVVALQPQTRRGPVPGYSMTAGKEVAISSENFEGHPRWDVVSLEEFHSPHRSRIVFSIRSDSTEAMHSALKEISHTIQANSHAHVVFVDCIVDGRVQMQHLYAPDGRGWTGNEAISDATLPLPK